MRCFKVCSCGMVWLAVPATARLQKAGDDFDGWYWECACLSTLFFPLIKQVAA